MRPMESLICKPLYKDEGAILCVVLLTLNLRHIQVDMQRMRFLWEAETSMIYISLKDDYGP